MRKIDISLVIPSHKGKFKLPALINSVKKNSIWPKQIIICGTNKNDISLIKKKDLELLNVNFIVSKIKNQVYQRKIALKKISQDYVLQLDDDLLLESNFFNTLLLHFKNKKKNIITMCLVIIPGLKEQAYRWNLYYRNNLYFRLLLRFFNYGKKIKYMSILPSGRICPYLPDSFINKKKVLKNLEWTNSSIFYHKSVLNYYDNFTYIKKNEKSFYEDVLFSHNLFKKGFKLQIDPKLRVIHPHFSQIDFSTHLKTLKIQYKIVKEFNKNYFMFVLDVILATIFLFFR
jgi:glycosyltransferase involved in cell wall biosynthesis